MAQRTRTSKAFTAFAIVMALSLMLGSLFVFGGAVFGTDPDEPDEERNEAQEQVAELETQVAANPEDGESAGILANIYANEGNVAAAIPLFERATQDRPDDGTLRLTFGIALLRAGSFLDARVQLERAHELLPDQTGPAFYLGELELRREEPDEDAARDWYEQAIATDPDSVLAEQAQARLDELDDNATPTQ